MNGFKHYSILIFLGLLIFAGCQKDNTEDKPDPVKIQNMVIKNDQAVLNQRLVLKNELVEMLPEYLPELKSGDAVPTDHSTNFTFKLRADVDAPTENGRTLMATHVAIKDQFAFVSYNLRGEEFGGAVDVFDVTVLTQPLIVSNATFPDADISSVDYRDGKIFIVGATSDFEEWEFESPAFFQVLSVNAQMQIQSVDTIIDIPSFSANGIKVTNDKIYITSGDTGGLIVFDREYNLLQENLMADARSVDLNSSNVYVLTGQPGKVNVFDVFSGNQTTQYEIGGANTPYSKSELSVNEEYIFAALNEEGVKMIKTDGTVKQHIPRPETPEGDLDENHVTNSVSLTHSLVFMANGQSGIAVGEIIPELDDEVQMRGKMIFSDMQSSNFVQSRDSIVFVASGLGGLKILAISIDEGVPDDVIPTETCPTLMTAISLFLPETENARKNEPQLFVPEAKLSVITAEETPVYVVFVDEGAGWRNTLGYYAYPVDNPPSTVEELQKYVVFPNVSLSDGGGGLDKGDMVQLGNAPFPPNTVIGFYLVAQGWKNGQMVEGAYTHYTDLQFNLDAIQQHVLFIENGCQDLVLAFEDIRLPKGDKDYNDIIFVIKDNDQEFVNTKFNVDGVVKINVVDEN
jgi:hypothetical protein